MEAEAPLCELFKVSVTGGTPETGFEKTHGGAPKEHLLGLVSVQMFAFFSQKAKLSLVKFNELKPEQ